MENNYLGNWPSQKLISNLPKKVGPAGALAAIAEDAHAMMAMHVINNFIAGI
jgi:hypothetical protein